MIKVKLVLGEGKFGENIDVSVCQTGVLGAGIMVSDVAGCLLC